MQRASAVGAKCARSPSSSIRAVQFRHEHQPFHQLGNEDVNGQPNLADVVPVLALFERVDLDIQHCSGERGGGSPLAYSGNARPSSFADHAA